MSSYVRCLFIFLTLSAVMASSNDLGSQNHSGTKETTLRSSRVLANIDDPPTDSLICRILLYDIQHEEKEYEKIFYMCNPVQDNEVSSRRYSIDLPSAIAQRHQSIVGTRSVSAYEQFYISIPGGYIDEVDSVVVVADPSAVTVLETSLGGRRLDRRTVTSVGTYKALVLRIIDKNGVAPMHSKERLFQSVFDTNGMSMHSQYKACSWNQFMIVPAGVGVIEVTVDRDSTDNNHQKLTQEAEKEALDMLGIQNLFDYTDFIIYVTPPMGQWIAYASVGGGFSVYNSAWGGYMSSLMHEVGHNLGLLHANDGELGSDDAEYKDFTGYMSGAKASYMKFDYPVQCFNGANHWQLGWYDPNHTHEVYPGSPEIVYVGAFPDRNKFSNVPTFQEYAVVKSENYYIQYNAQWGMNRDTNESGDKLTITYQWNDGTYLVGEVAKVPGSRWTLPNTQWSIEVCELAVGSSTYAEVVAIWVGNGTPDCSSSTTGAGLEGEEEEDNSTCKANLEICTLDSECCSGHCRPDGVSMACLPNPNSHAQKNQWRISNGAVSRTGGVRRTKARGVRGYRG